MPSVDMKRVKELFFSLLELQDDAARQAFLEKECGEDQELKQGVLDLFKGHQAPVTALQRPFLVSSEILEVTQALPDEYIGTVIAGKYKILELIGEGGMGNVYMAQQISPVNRLVAIKLIKPGMDSKTILARFEAERQALAMMDHPNIAKVLDGGATAAGLPYFVMKLVKGIPITKFCDERKLSPNKRLELFIPVCDAIHHAHQKGIIHRDIKPSNVLVAMHDDKPVPMVIDFGVAKAMGAQLTDKTAFTGFGAVVGTPEYMSPEQATFNQQDIDTRSDVYSLGVLLYELLTGTTPFDRKSLANFAVLEMLRIVREMEPPTPSLRLSTDAGLPSIAANRNVEPGKLKNLLKGELDWVIMKTLDKDRSRRYDSASNLARDIQRFLNDEIVEARPPSAWYRTSKFLRKHRVIVLASSLVLISLVGGLIGITLGLIEAHRQQGLAEAARKEAEDSAIAEKQSRQDAVRQKEIATQALKATEDAARSESTARKAAEQAALEARRQQEMADAARRKAENAVMAEKLAREDAVRQKEIATKARQAAEKAAISESASRKAAEAAAEAEKVARQNADRRLKQVNKANEILGQVFMDLNPGKVENKGKLLQELLAEQLDKASSQLNGDDLGDPLTIASLQYTLGNSQRALGYPQKAIDLLIRSRDNYTKLYGPNHPQTLAAMNSLGAAYRTGGHFEKAVTEFEETLKRRKEVLGSKEPQTLATMGNLAFAHRSAGRLDRAILMAQEVLELKKMVLGSEHADTLDAMQELALYLFEDNRLLASKALYQEALKKQEEILGSDNFATLLTLNGLGSTLMSLGEKDQAVTIFQRTYQGYRNKLGADHPHTLAVENNLASSYRSAGKIELAVPIYKGTFERYRAKMGIDHPHTLITMTNYASACGAAKQFDTAIPIYLEALGLQKGKLGANHPNTINTMMNLGKTYMEAGDFAASIPIGEEALRIQKENGRLKHPYTESLFTNLGKAHYQLKNYDESEKNYLGAVNYYKNHPGPSRNQNLELSDRQFHLARAMIAQGKWAAAAAALRECQAIREKLDPDHWSTYESLALLGSCLSHLNDEAAAEGVLLRSYSELKKREKSIPAGKLGRIRIGARYLADLYAAMGREEDAVKWRGIQTEGNPATKPGGEPGTGSSDEQEKE